MADFNMFNTMEDKNRNNIDDEKETRVGVDNSILNWIREKKNTFTQEFPKLSRSIGKTFLPITTVAPGFIQKKPFETGLISGLIEDASFNTLPASVIEEYAGEKLQRESQDYKEGKLVGSIMGTMAAFKMSSMALGATGLPKLIAKGGTALKRLTKTFPRMLQFTDDFTSTIKMGTELAAYGALRKPKEAELTDVLARAEQASEYGTTGLILPPVLKGIGKTVKGISKPFINKIKNSAFEKMNQGSPIEKMIIGLKEKGIKLTNKLVKKVSQGRTTNPMQLNIDEVQKLQTVLVRNSGRKAQTAIDEVYTKAATEWVKQLPKKTKQIFSEMGIFGDIEKGIKGKAKQYLYSGIRTQRLFERLDGDTYGVHSMLFDRAYYGQYNGINAFNVIVNNVFEMQGVKVGKIVGQKIKLPSGKVTTMDDAITVYHATLEAHNLALLKDKPTKEVVKAMKQAADMIRTGIYKGKPITDQSSDFIIDSVIRGFPTKKGYTYSNDTLEILNKGMKYSKEDIVASIKAVVKNPNAKALADKMIKWTNVLAKMYRKEFASITGKEIPNINNWLSERKVFGRVGKGTTKGGLDDISDAVVSGNSNKISKVIEKYSKHRPLRYQIMIETSSVKNFLYRTQRMSDFIFKAAPMNSLKKVMTDEWATEVTGKMGKEFTRELYKNVNDISGNTFNPYLNWTDDVLKTARLNIGAFITSYKLSMGLNQIVSIANAVPSISKATGQSGYKHMANNILKYYVGGQKKAMTNRMMKSSGKFIKNRFIERQLQEEAEMGALSRTLGKGIKRKLILKPGRALMKKLDKDAVAITWNATYDAKVAGMGKKIADQQVGEIARIANDVVRRTQPMGGKVDLPSLYKAGELAKAATMFTNMPNQVLNLMYEHAGSKTALAGKIIGNIILPAAMLSGIRSGGETWKRAAKGEPKDLLADMAMYPLAIFPIAGGMLSSMIKGYEYGLPVMKPIQEIQTTIKSKTPETKIKHAIKAVGMTTGLIPDQLLRSAKGAIELYTDETDDFRRLIWTSYQLKEEKKAKKRLTIPKLTMKNVFKKKKEFDITKVF